MEQQLLEQRLMDIRPTALSVTSGHIEQYGGAQILVDSDCENGPVESGTAEYDGPGGTDESQGPSEDSVCQS